MYPGIVSLSLVNEIWKSSLKCFFFLAGGNTNSTGHIVKGVDWILLLSLCCS